MGENKVFNMPASKTVSNIPSIPLQDIGDKNSFPNKEIITKTTNADIKLQIKKEIISSRQSHPNVNNQRSKTPVANSSQNTLYDHGVIYIYIYI